MRSPYPTPGRNRRLENLWRTLTGYVRALFRGSQRPLVQSSIYHGSPQTARARNYDLEIQEFPIRDAERARSLIEMVEWCPEIGTATGWIVDDVLSSEDGDDQGIVVSQELIDHTPIDPQVYQIATDAITRIFPVSNLEVIAKRVVNWGDAFASLALDTSKNQVSGLMLLPTWEMFRVESQGELLGFQQRRRISDEDPDYTFIPAEVVHWRYRRENLYGRSLYYESIEDWERLKRSTDALALACDAVGVNPNNHIMPEGTTPEQLQDYQSRHEQRLADGLITDYYLMPGQDIRKLSAVNPDLQALADTVLFWRKRIVMKSRVPPYLLGLPAEGARDISGQPAMAYARFINRVRMSLSEGILQVLFTDLWLKGINPDLWLNKICLVYPKIVTSAVQGVAQVEGDDGEEDLDADLDSTRLFNHEHYQTFSTLYPRNIATRFRPPAIR